MRKLLAAFALSLALAISLAPGLALAAEGGGLTVGSASDSSMLTTQAAATPKISITRAATGKVAMKVGKSYNLGAKTTAGKLTYKSSNTKVATVSSKGVVKAKKTGKATVTVTAKNGTKKSTKKVNMTVLSASKYKGVKAIKAKASASKLEVGKTATISVAFTPTASSNKNVTFKSSNTRIATVNAAGKVTAKAAGKVRITATSCDNAKAKSAVTVTVTESAPVVLPDSVSIQNTPIGVELKWDRLPGYTPETVRFFVGRCDNPDEYNYLLQGEATWEDDCIYFYDLNATPGKTYYYTVYATSKVIDYTVSTEKMAFTVPTNDPTRRS